MLFLTLRNGLENSGEPTTYKVESELVKLGDFKIVERNEIENVLEEQKLQVSGITEQTIIDVGNILSAVK